MAQGPISIGGISAGNSGNSVEINHPTVGRLPDGANVERTVPTELAANNQITLVLRNDDFSTAARLNKVINSKFGSGTTKALDGRNLDVFLPASYADNRVGFIAELESLRVTPDKIAKIIINEGRRRMGSEVDRSVAISQGGVTIRVGIEYDVIQPAVHAESETAVVLRRKLTLMKKRPYRVWPRLEVTRCSGLGRSVSATTIIRSEALSRRSHEAGLLSRSKHTKRIAHP